MEIREDKIRIFTPFERSLHLLALGLSPLLCAAGMAAKGGSAAPALLHAVAAYGLLFLLVAHLAKFLSGWLERGSNFELLARAGDFGDALSGALSGLGLAKRPLLTYRGYRQRLPYTAFLFILPFAVLTGAVYGHPGGFVGLLGPSGVYFAAKLHLLLGTLLLGALIWHACFAFLCPAALWWNGAFLTGFQSREKFLAMNPDSASRVEPEEKPAAVEEHEEEGPGVEELLIEGNRLAKAGDYAGAAAAFRRALEIYPGYPQALFNLGACLYRLGETGEAGEVLRSYLKQDEFGEAADRARSILREIENAEAGK